MQHSISFHPSGEEGQGPITVVRCNCVLWQAAMLYLADRHEGQATPARRETHLDNHDKPRTDSITDFLTVITANLYPSDVCTPMGGKTPADEGALGWKETFSLSLRSKNINRRDISQLERKLTEHLRASDYGCQSAEVSKQQYRLFHSPTLQLNAIHLYGLSLDSLLI